MSSDKYHNLKICSHNFVIDNYLNALTEEIKSIETKVYKKEIIKIRGRSFQLFVINLNTEGYCSGMSNSLYGFLIIDPQSLSGIHSFYSKLHNINLSMILPVYEIIDQSGINMYFLMKIICISI